MNNGSDDNINPDLIWQIFLNNGDKFSFSAIYRHYAEELFSYGLRLGFSEENCKDAIQDIFYKLFISRGQLKKAGNPVAYLFSSYRNRLIDLIRKEQPTIDLDTIAETFTLETTVADTIIEREEAASLKKQINEMLSPLTGREREMVYLRFRFSLGYSEIAKITGITSDSARKSIYRIMQKLRSGSDKTR